MDPTTRYTLRRNTASIMKIWFYIFRDQYKSSGGQVRKSELKNQNILYFISRFSNTWTLLRLGRPRSRRRYCLKDLGWSRLEKSTTVNTSAQWEPWPIAQTKRRMNARNLRRRSQPIMTAQCQALTSVVYLNCRYRSGTRAEWCCQLRTRQTETCQSTRKTNPADTAR